MEEQSFELFSLDSAIQRIAQQLSVPVSQTMGAVRLLEDGCTIPFIARYRKEATGALDEMALRRIEDELAGAKELAQRKTTILRTVAEQGQLTDQLRKEIESCQDRKKLEDLYLPFKPKRRTRATLARERGLEPLAEILLRQERLNLPPEEVIQPYIDPEKELPDIAAVLQGACDIVAEQWSENPSTRSWMAQQAGRGKIVSQVKRGKKDPSSKFEMYFDHEEPLARAPSHRLLAMKRGEAEGILRIGINMDDDYALSQLKDRLVTNRKFELYRELLATVEDCYHRLLFPATESAVLQDLKEAADEEAIAVFAQNLRDLLLTPPAGPRVTIGIDPGYRTGCKVAVVDGTGKFLTQTTIYPTAPRNDLEGAATALNDLIQRYQAELIAIGNGTASRETDAFVTDLIRKEELSVTKVVVNESGASIYSASEVAIQEYPDLDVTVRGAISIAHRLQDPLAELVKIDPRSIGVGQYQHDVNQALLKKSLDREVESCVSSVGVDVNMASASLLSYVSGIGPKLAQRVVAYRDEHGRFPSRARLMDVPKLGKKAFEQSAGFLRIRDGEQPLDNSAVHPESYPIVKQMASHLQVRTEEIVGSPPLVARLQPKDFVTEQVGLPTIQDILAELAKPGRDPRKEFKVASFAEGVHELEDLQQGMVLEGVVTNVTRFGAFVDIGVHQDGLVHISQLDQSYVEDPADVVTVGDVIRVKVLEVDLERKRISLSRKQAQ